MSTESFWRTHLKLRHLRLLIALDEHRNVARVAEALHVTQPAVSRTLAEIEAGLGVELFERLHRGIIPTSAGECLISHAREITIDLSRAREALESHVLGDAGVIAVGSLPAATSVLLPRALTVFSSQLPNATAVVREGSFDSLLPELRARRIHLIVGTLIPSRSHRDLDEQALDTKTLTLVARRGHPLLTLLSDDWTQLNEWPWVLPPIGSPLRDPLEEALAERGVRRLRPRLETTSTQLVRTYVSMTDAIAFMPSDAAVYFDEAGLLLALPLRLHGLVRPTGVIWSRDRPLDALSRRFVECLESVCRSSTPEDEPKN